MSIESDAIRPGRHAAYQPSIGSQTTAVANTEARVGRAGRQRPAGVASGSDVSGGDAVATLCMAGTAAETGPSAPSPYPGRCVHRFRVPKLVRSCVVSVRPRVAVALTPTTESEV